MLNSNICYPFPLLRTQPYDFKTAFFDDSHEIVTKENCYSVICNFKVDNPVICNLIEQKIISYAVYISCPHTLFRTLRRVEAKDQFDISSCDVHFKVEITPCIISNSYFEYYCDDFSEDFENEKFIINEGDIIGIGEEHFFDALYEEDFINNSAAIIDVDSKADISYMQIDLDNPHIIVYLPIEQKSNYMTCKTAKEKYALLNAIVVIPALVEAINMICEENEDFSENAWYVTLKRKIQRYAEENNCDYENLLQHPTETAERLLANNSATAINSVMNY